MTIRLPAVLPLEFRLLCLAARPVQDPAGLAAAIAEGPDWAIVRDGGARHRIGAQLLSALQPFAGRVPTAILDDLRRHVRDTAFLALAHAAETARLAAEFAEAGIRVLVLKGVVLSSQLHGDFVSRGAGDIDLLVAAADFWAADGLLRKAGYEPVGPALSEARKIAGQHVLRDLTYRRGNVIVELHQRLTTNPHALPTDFETLWADRRTVAVAGTAVATLPARFLPVYLCVHGALHCWQRLRWLLDLGLLLREPGAEARIVADAAELGLAKPVRLAASLASGLLMLGDAAWTPAAERFCMRFYKGDRWRMMQESNLAGFRRMAWMLAYGYGLKGAWAYAWTALVAELRSPADWEVLSLPDRLIWLYPVLRPVGWLLRRLRRRTGGR
ncbi:MAG: nucleotidyltransferase family protein [Alphaproteobacteria bacterium]